MSTDPRTSAVESNLLDLFRLASTLPVVEPEGHDDVTAYHSEVPIPLFNAVCDASFTSGERTREVLAPYLQRGLPFMWWLTPSTTSPGIEAALAEAGLEPEHVPGMHRPVGAPTEVLLGPTTEVRQVPPAQFDAFMDVCIRGFEFPEFARAPMGEMLSSVDPTRMLNVVASVDGEPAAAGSVYLTGEVAGLYNIATLPAFRGHGLGHAVTVALVDVAREHGCTEAVLHATEMGRPVYQRAGFVEVCAVPQWVWAPQG